MFPFSIRSMSALPFKIIIVAGVLLLEIPCSLAQRSSLAQLPAADNFASGAGQAPQSVNNPGSIDKLEAAYQQNPGSDDLRRALCSAYANNGSAILKASPKEALRWYHKCAYMCGLGDSGALQNVDAAISAMGRSPSSFDDRVAIADVCRVDGDNTGALVEYLLALKIKEDPVVRQKLDHLPLNISSLPKPLTLPKAVASPPTDFAPYMAALHPLIHRHWFPDKSKENEKIAIAFTVDRQGWVSNLKVDTSSGVPSQDQAAMDAIKASEPLPALPPGIPLSVPILYHFNYHAPQAQAPAWDAGAYMAAIEPLIKRHWFPLKDRSSERVAVTFTVDKQGFLSNLKIETSCGVPAQDQAALAAVKASEPLPALPPGAPNTAPIRFTFDRHMPHKDQVSPVASAKSTALGAKLDNFMGAPPGQMQPAPQTTSLQNAEALTSRGNEYYMHKQYDLALADFNQSIALNPNSAIAYWNRGRLYDVRGQEDKAIFDLDKAIQLNGQLIEAYGRRAHVYNKLRNYLKAYADASDSIRIQSNYIYGLTERAVALEAMNRYPEALKDLDTAVVANPQDSVTYGYRGKLYSDLRRYDEAIADYSKAISLDSGSAYYYSCRAAVFTKQGRADLAALDTQKAAALTHPLNRVN